MKILPFITSISLDVILHASVIDISIYYSILSIINGQCLCMSPVKVEISQFAYSVDMQVRQIE
jgi:hypothetical protein